MDNKVIYLKYSNDALHKDYVAFIACNKCKNKTFVVLPANEDDMYPMLRCAACSTDIGRIGWTEE